MSKKVPVSNVSQSCCLKRLVKISFIILLTYRTLLSYSQCEHLWSVFCLTGQRVSSKSFISLRAAPSLGCLGSQSRGPDTYVYTGVQEEGLTAGGRPDFKLDTYKSKSNTGAVPPIVYTAFESHTRLVLGLKGL